MAHPTVLPSAEDVGNAFVSQYYIVLHQSPQEMHRFYTNSSWFTYAEAGGAGRTFVAQTAIHDKFMCLDYGDFKTEIKSVDSQESVDEGVLVLVTGALIGKNSTRINFVQSFVLARQEKGYYVRNDVFRFLEDENAIKPTTAVVHNDIQETSPQTVGPQEPVFEPAYPATDELLESDFRNQSGILEEEHIVEEVYDLPERVEISDAEDYTEQEEEVAHLDTLSLLSEIPVTTHVETSAPLIDETVAEPPKKSYASILRKSNSGSTVSVQNTVKTVPVGSERAMGLATPAQSQPPLPVQENVDEGLVADVEGEGRSIYIKSLPVSVTASQLSDEFSKFGSIRPGGISIRSMKGFCYAFVEFEDSSSAQSTIEASPVLVGGRPAYIEEKRPQPSRAVRGRGSSGRGERSFRYDGIGSRGRGMASGRGLGRNVGTGQDRDRDAFKGHGSGGRGSYNGNGSSSFTSDYTTSTNFDGRHSESQGGSAARFSRRQISGGVPAARTGSAVSAA